MTNCWSEGALRAYLDRELPAGDMKLVAAHLGECSACDALCTELAARASRVFALLEALPQPETVRMRPATLRAQGSRSSILRRYWPAAAVALAAGLAIASFVTPKPEERLPVVAGLAPRVTPRVAPPVAPLVESLERTEPVPLKAVTASTARPSSGKLTARRHNVPPSTDYFLALDDGPIESGVIMRVAVGQGNAQADIVFDPGGRARAIRLVGNKY